MTTGVPAGKGKGKKRKRGGRDREGEGKWGHGKAGTEKGNMVEEDEARRKGKKRKKGGGERAREGALGHGKADTEKGDIVVEDEAQRKERTYGSVASMLMAKMGYKEGEGLGRCGDGIRDPIAVLRRPRNRGLDYVGGQGARAKEKGRDQ